LLPNERSHRKDKPATSKHKNVKIELENKTSRLIYCSIRACLLDDILDDLITFV
jgi:hypothetical protein